MDQTNLNSCVCSVTRLVGRSGSRSVRNSVRFEVLTARSMKMAVFFDVAVFNVVHTNGCIIDNSDDEGSKLLLSVGPYVPDYTMQHPGRRPSSRR